MRVKITGTGSAVPARKVSNEELSRFVETSDEWIKSRTGIRSRYLAVEETTTDLAVEAAEKALADAEMKAEELDLILAATVTPDKYLPNLACEVQSALGARQAVAFDVNAACSGFLFGMQTAFAYLSCGIYKNALIIGAETLSRLMDWTDRSTCVLFGDGAGAAVLSAGESETGGRGILSMLQGSDGARGNVLCCDNRPIQNPYVSRKNDSPAYVAMNGQEVYKFAVRTVPDAVVHVTGQAGLALDDIDLFLLHQANYRIIEAVAKRLGQPMEKFPTNLQECGNISAASVPILLDNVKSRGMIKPGSKLVLTGFGAGLTWGAVALEW